MKNRLIFFAISILTLSLTFMGLFPFSTFADSTTLEFFPISVTDTTPIENGLVAAQAPREYTSDLPKITHLNTFECITDTNSLDFLANSTSWISGSTDYDELSYLEYHFSSTKVPDTAIIDGVDFKHSYFSPTRLINGAKIEVVDSNDSLLESHDVSVPQHLGCANAVTDVVPLSSIDTPAKVNSFKVRFTAYNSTGTNGPKLTWTDYVSVIVRYHMPTDPPVADTQDVGTHSVDSSFPITLSGSASSGGSLVYSIVSTSTKGDLSNLTGNQITYTPNGVLGDDSFVFKVNDGFQDSATSTVTIHLSHGLINNLSLFALPVILNVGDFVGLAISGYDKFGNPVTSDNSTVINLSSDVGSVTSTSTTLSNGVATTTATSNVGGITKYFASTGTLSASTTVAFLLVASSDSSTSTATSTSETASSTQTTSTSTEIISSASSTTPTNVPRGELAAGAPIPYVAQPVHISTQGVVPQTPVSTETAVVSTPAAAPVLSPTVAGASIEPTVEDTSVSQVADNSAVVGPEKPASQDLPPPPPELASALAATQPEPVVGPTQEIPTANNLSASVVNSGVDFGETTKNIAIVSFGLVLIGAIYVFAWHPFRKI